jgi:uncharacterized protein
MARPASKRVIEKPPLMEGFKPFGIPVHDLEPAVLLFDEFEALRLADYLGLAHQEAARRMNVSRPTFTRICDKARRTLATALVEGKALFIEGGAYQTEEDWYRCESCWKLISSADETSGCPYCRADTVRRLSPEAPMCQANGHCICAHCRTRIPQVKGEPCREKRCPTCRRTMLREGACHHPLHLKKKK